MTNALIKNIEVIFTPEIQARGAIPSSPRVEEWYENITTNVCSVVETGGSYVRQRKLVWVEDLSIPSGGYYDIIDGFVWVPASTQRVCRDIVTTIYHPVIPEVIGSPAIAYSPAKTEYRLNPGWNSGARSARVFPAAGFVSFQVPVAVGVFVGFNDADVGYEYAEMEHSFYCVTSTGYKIYESGVEKFAGGTFDPATAVFKIRRVDAQVTYFVDDVLVYTSLMPSTGVVIMDASMYLGGDTINSPKIEEIFIARSAARFKELRGTAADYSYNSAVNSFLPLASRNVVDSSSAGAFRILRGVAADLPFTSSSPSMLPMLGYANSGLLAPEYTVSNGRMYSVVGHADANTLNHSGANTKTRRLRGASSDYDYNESVNPILRLRTYVVPIEPEAPTTAQYLPAPKLRAFGGGSASLMSPAASIEFLGHDSEGENAFSYTARAATLQSFGGGFTDIATPSSQLVISGTSVNWGAAELVSPAGTLTAQGVVGSVGTFSASMPVPSLTGYFGGVVSVTIGSATLNATGVTGSVGWAELAMPLFELEASGTAQNYGNANLISPAAQLVHGGVAWLTSPAAKLTAIGSAVVAYSYEGYNVNLSHTSDAPVDEVTHYTNYPFTHIVRYQNSYFGASPEGLFLLEGTTDDGVAIPYSVKTCVNDFDKNELKTVSAAYLAGKLSSPCTVTLYAGESGQESYPYNTIRGPLAQNHREKFGRGVKNRYFALGFDGGGVMELDAVELEVATMKRRI